jgi:diguanylate cyclase (GGDEF)-like protein
MLGLASASWRRPAFDLRMLSLDVISSFAICGIGALAGAGLLRPAQGYDKASIEVLRLSRVAFLLIGLGMSQILLHPAPLPLWSLATLAFASTGGLTMMAWALAALSGRIVPRRPMWLALGLLGVACAALTTLGIRGVTWFVTWGLAAASALLLGLAHRLVLRPRGLDERLTGLLMVAVGASSACRVLFLVAWDGPYEPHLLHLPQPLVLLYALMYGLLPILTVILVLNVLNDRLQSRLHQLAMTDALTGAMSRVGLAEEAELLRSRLSTGQRRLAVLMVDMDHFKAINDTLGHAAGDKVLRCAAEMLRSALRRDALLARYGGEEFVAMVPVADLQSACQVAERMRRLLAQAPWADVVPGLQGLTASVGVTLLEDAEPMERALARADEALYRAKNGGRNQVQVGMAS